MKDNDIANVTNDDESAFYLCHSEPGKRGKRKIEEPKARSNAIPQKCIKNVARVVHFISGGVTAYLLPTFP